jgi:hypothetical protein
MSGPPDLSVIIPVFNRGDLIHYTLESVRRASKGLSVEVVVVDDGSDPPVAEALSRLGFAPDVLVRQDNQGLLFARLAGLSRASGRNILFLDSDDLVGPDKFRLQLAAMRESGAEVSYTDHAFCELEGPYDALRPRPAEPCADTEDPADFFILVQPPPHSPLFRADYLRGVVAGAWFPPSRLYNCVAEIWFYHNAAARPGRTLRVPGPHTIVGSHPGGRLTGNWEKLAVASLAVMEAFARSCPYAPETAKARQRVGETAFRSWRKLPRGFPEAFAERELAVWKRLAPDSTAGLSGPAARTLAWLVGAERAGRALRRWRNRPYGQLRTLSDDEMAALMTALPRP